MQEGDVVRRLAAYLDEAGCPWREINHGPTRTSEQSARERGEPLEIGGKALLLKAEQDYRLFVLSAARRLDSAAVKRHFGVRRLRFATPEELLERTGLVPGSVPPFGEPVLPFPLYIDDSVFANDRIAFNAGTLTRSIVLGIEDYRGLVRPEVFSFSQD